MKHKERFKTSKMIISATLAVALISFSAVAKDSIQKMTSKKAAKEASGSISETEPSRSADNLKIHSLGVGLGQTFLKGDFEDNGDDSITLDVYYNYSASYSFDLMVNAHYSSHDLGNREVNISGAAVGIKGKIYQFDNFSPFGIAGLGFYAPKVTRIVADELKESDTKVVFGTHFGAGGELRLNREVVVGILAHYHNPFDVKQELDPEVEGSYYKLLITTFYSF